MPKSPHQHLPSGVDPKSRAAMRGAVERELVERDGDGKKSMPPSIPDHVLAHRIGRGAYGEVWLARTALGTSRAVKVVYRSRFEEARPYEREFNGILKYEPVSRTHEGLVQVLHVGRNDELGCFYYVMELADAAEPPVHGSRLEGSVSARRTDPAAPGNQRSETYTPRTLRSELIQRQRLPPIDAAQLTLRLANALAHLHAHGLVHRDIKPGNVIFVDGEPKLADIGLVTDVGSSHSFVGTEGFIPPEGPGTPRADLYALGKLLYELATGRDRLDFPQLPPGVTRLPGGDALLELNEVMTRACAPEPEHRYASATELQADLNLFLSGRSLRRARDIERHLAGLKRFAAASLVLLLLASAVIWLAKKAERQANERERQASQRALIELGLRHRAEAAEHAGRQQLYTALLEQARATVQSGELGQRVGALDAIRRAAAISNAADLRREALAAMALPDLRFEREFPIARGVTIKKLDPALERVALCRGGGAIEIRAVSNQRLLATLPASTNLPAYAGLWSRDGRFLAAKRDYRPGGEHADLEVWELPSARRVLLFRKMSRTAMSFHPQRCRIMTGRASGALTTWDLENGQEVTRFQLTGAPIRLEFAPDGERFAALVQAGSRWIVSVHDASNGTQRMSHSFASYVWDLDWHPSGRWIAMCDSDGAVHSLNAETGEAHALGRHKMEATTTVFSPEGDYLISGGWERELICWDVRTMQRAFTMGLHSFRAQFHANGRKCAIVTDTGVQLYAFERPNHREFAEDLGSRLRQASFSSDGRWLAASADKCLGVWDLADQGPGALAEEGAEARLSFTPDGGELFGSRNEDNCFRWQITPKTNTAGTPVLQRIDLSKPRGFTSLALASNWVVYTGSAGSRIVPRENVASQESHWVSTSRGISGASPDGQWLGIFRPFTPFLYIYHLPGLERVAKLTNQANIFRFKFSPRGDEVAVATRNRVEFWSTNTWERTRVITNFSDIVFAPDGRLSWLTRDFRTAGLYDVHTLEPLLPLPTGMVPLVVSPDGRYLAVSVDLRRLQIWDLTEVRERFRELGVDWGR